MSRTRSAAPAPPRLRRAIPLLISLLAALSLTSGCASLAPSPPRSGADGLRAAAEETKKRPEDQKPLVVRPRPEPSEVSNTVVVVDREAHVDAEPVEEPPAAPRHRSLQGWHAGLVGGTGTIGGPTFAPAGEFGLKIGMTPSRALHRLCQPRAGGLGSERRAFGRAQAMRVRPGCRARASGLRELVQPRDLIVGEWRRQKLTV